MKICATVLACICAASSALGVSWTPISRTSTVTADGSGGGAAPASATGFQTSNLSIRTAGGNANVTQYFSLNSTSVTLRSSVTVSSSAGSVMQGIPGTWGSGGSLLKYRFSVSSAVAYVLEGKENSLPITTDPPVALVALKNTSTNVYVVNNGGGGLSDGPFSYTGLLAAGTYELTLDTNMYGSAGLSGSQNLEANLTIRENVQFSYPRPRPVYVPPLRSMPVYVNVSSPDAPPIPGTGKIFYRLSGTTTFQSRSMTEISPNEYVGTLPSTTCGKTIEYYFTVKAASGEDVLEPAAAPATLFSTGVRNEVEVAFDSESSAGFIATANGATSGAWQNRFPTASAFAPTTGHGGSGKAWVTDNRLGFDVDGGPVVLTTPAVDMSGAYYGSISYAIWFYSSAADTHLYIDVSSDGGVTWKKLSDLYGSTWQAAPKWYASSILPTDLGVPLTTQMRLRFSVADAGESVTTEAAVDEITFFTRSCTPGCIADFNGDTAVDFTDFDDFVTLFEAGSAASDANRDGFIDFTDFDAFVGAFEAGC